MELIYKLNFNLTTGMFDEFENIKPYAVFDMFQEIAGRHAEVLGIGKSFCTKNNYGWIVARQEIHILGKFIPNTMVEVITLPHIASKFECKREYMIKYQGHIIASGCALWILLDFTTRKMLRTDNIYPEGNFVNTNNYQDKLLKPFAVENKEELFVDNYTVSKDDIDSYHHMNNASYARLIYKICSKFNFNTKYGISICYHHEIKENNTMKIYQEEKDNNIYITGIGEKVIFSAVILKEDNYEIS